MTTSPHLPPGPPEPPSSADLRARLDALGAWEAQRLGRRLDGLRRRRDRGRGRRDADDAARARDLARLADDVAAAEARLARRAAAVPRITYPPELPVTTRREELLAALRDHQVVVVAGETGSGKSTQLPKLCLELGRGVRGWIGHTQPRRLAARTVAERVAEELGGEVGGAVGYAVRFTDRVGDDTLVKVMTDGILLAEIRRDPMLARYDTIILDEAHERSLNIDFLVGYLARLLPRRPDLHLVVTSATIDTERIAAHFGGAPVVSVSGRTYPVEVRYRPVGVEPEDDRDQVQAICDAVEELEGAGDVLVFLSGEREIRDAAEALARLDLPRTEVLPLYARLPSADQHRIFQPHAGRRVVLATNVAETSLTVPGIRAVVDTGTARVSRYSRRLKVQRLPIEPISRASADQRAGRCGRVAPGTCIRLYAEDDLAARPEFTEPEILRTNLASVILQMAALDLGDVAAFPFLDPPDPRSVRDGVILLEELGALEPGDGPLARRLTPIGRRLAHLPVDPRLGRMVLAAGDEGCVREAMVIAAALSIQDPRERPRDDRVAADEAHARFADPDSDFLSFLHLWRYLREQQEAMSSNRFRRMCHAEHLNHQRVREWQDVVSQLRQVAATVGLAVQHDPAPPDSIHRALLAGLLSHVGLREGDATEHRGARGARFTIAPGSALARRSPRWVMAAELVETGRLWARVVARVEPEWIERVGAHLVKRSYGEPRWDARRGLAMTTERVTIHGLPVVAARPVPYQRVDPAAARELFLRHALVEGDWQGRHPFVAANRATLARARTLEDRARRADLLVDDDDLVAWFSARVPADVTSATHLDRWWKGARRTDPQLLELAPADVLRPGAGIDLAAFPDTWGQGDVELALSYEFLPGSPTDGLSVHVPVAVLDRLDPGGFGWQVPGLRRELVVALVRVLPKAVRRHLVPATEHADAFLADVSPADGPLLDELAHAASATSGEPVDFSEWDVERVPAHLRPTFVVEDERGRWIGIGKDLAELQERLRADARRSVAAAFPDLTHEGLTGWTIGALPRTVSVRRPGHTVTGHPALVDVGDTVAVRVLPTAHEQQRAMHLGTRRLLLLGLRSPRTTLDRRLRNETKLTLSRGPHATVAEAYDDCVACAVDLLVERHGGPAWDDAGWAALAEAVRAGFEATVVDVATAAAVVVARVTALEGRLAGLAGAALVPSIADVGAQLSWLVHPGYLTVTGARRLPDLARYLAAVDRRLDRLPADPARDQQRMRPIQRLEEEYADLVAALLCARVAADVADVRWMIEELRVSTFAQSLGTDGPVSVERIRREMARVAAGA